MRIISITQNNKKLVDSKMHLNIFFNRNYFFFLFIMSEMLNDK